MQSGVKFELTDMLFVPDRQLVTVPLVADGDAAPGIRATANGITFSTRGWFEVLLTVGWPTSNTRGHRFAHTAAPDHHPLHSEAIDASVLAALSDGKQLLRGNTIFEPGGIDTITHEVWQDSSSTLSITDASLLIRPLP